ncbi:Fungal specific transcription factor domain-containing protein [Cladophialophora immunda]|nr:Fungal specific transcription factor domain-containing protein [Cladophialophora immunda]
MSLRLSSLDPNEPRALKGQSLRDAEVPCTVGPVTGAGYAVIGVCQHLLAGSEPIAVPHKLRNAFQPSFDETTLHNPFALNLDLSSYALPQYLQGRPVRQLIHYYDHVVATVMPWVDGPENPWRTLMLPLAMHSPSLLLALLALSAEHYSARSESPWAVNDGFASRNYRDKSLLLLSEDLRAEWTEHASVARHARASGILATILVLCNLEMIRCDSAIWRVHWKAARTITLRWTAPQLATTVLDDTCRFLIKEAFVYDVFGSSTTFEDDEQIPGSVLTEQDAHVFTDWLQLVQEVTCAERQRHRNASPGQAPLDLANMRVLQEKFDYARNRSLEFSKSLDFGTPGLHSDFAVLVDIFHYAGLAYSFQALLDPRDFAPAIETCVSGVITKIAEIQNKEAYQHDLVWPLFVVGTQSRLNKNTQAFADAKLLEVMKSTGFSNCVPALEFLRRFWKSDPNVAVDWMQFARQESRRGLTFLVI